MFAATQTQQATTVEFDLDWLKSYLQAAVEAWREREVEFPTDHADGKLYGGRQAADDLEDLLTDPEVNDLDQFLVALVVLAWDWKNYTLSLKNDFDRGVRDGVREAGVHLTALISENWTR